MKYTTIFFDAYQTLMDFEDAEHQALERTFAEYHLSLNEEIHQLYQQINQSLWNAFEKNLIQKQQLLRERFGQLFQKLHIENIDPSVFNHHYLYNLGFGSKTLPGAVEVCRKLYNMGLKLYILTNGVSKTQRRRLSASGLLPYVQDVFVSEEAGFQKPLKGYFDYVFARIPDFDAGKTLMVGDSLTSDILGANQAGLDSCWFNPQKKPRPQSPHIDFEISSLEEILQCIAD